MTEIRIATVDDAALIAEQRRLMFQDNGLNAVGSWEDLERDSAAWTAKHLAAGTYAGWIVEEDGRAIGGAGLWVMEWPPHFLHPEPQRGYLLNFYVAPAARGRGLAKRLVGLATEECQRRGLRFAVLHASPMGKSVYEGLGWKQGNEMRLQLEPLAKTQDQ